MVRLQSVLWDRMPLLNSGRVLDYYSDIWRSRYVSEGCYDARWTTDKVCKSSCMLTLGFQTPLVSGIILSMSSVGRLGSAIWMNLVELDYGRRLVRWTMVNVSRTRHEGWGRRKNERAVLCIPCVKHGGTLKYRFCRLFCFAFISLCEFFHILEVADEVPSSTLVCPVNWYGCPRMIKCLRAGSSIWFLSLRVGAKRTGDHSPAFLANVYHYLSP